MIKSLINSLRNNNYLYKSFLNFISLTSAEDFSEVECFCLFIGYPYSGHTIIGALLDAHPEIVISIEADVLGLIEKGYSRNLIYSYILRRNRKFVSKNNASWMGYSYRVPGSYQGKYRILRIIGDKKGAGTTNRLKKDFNLLLRLQELVGKPIKMIHVVRHPLDNIASIMIRAKEKNRNYTEGFFKSRIDYYFNNAEMNLSIMNAFPQKVITIHHEDFIQNPKDTFKHLLLFLAVDPSEKYIDQCSRIVRNSPHLTRNLISWPEDLKEYAMDQAKKYPFFNNYL